MAATGGPLAPGMAATGGPLAPGLSSFYTYDGTWRTSEPSWRVLLGNSENVRGCPSKGNSLNDPALLNTLQRGRRAKRGVEATPPRPEARQEEIESSAAAAAAAFAVLSYKDQKNSGFANVTQTHTAINRNDPVRWGRLGMMTRERLINSDRFGDIDVPHVMRPWSAPAAPRPSVVEKSGFTRGLLKHSSDNLTGGHVYVEYDPPPPPEAAQPAKVVGNKLPTGFAVNNRDEAAEDAVGGGGTVRPAVTPQHWKHMGIGASGNANAWFEGNDARMTAYGEMRRRKLAPHEAGEKVNTLKVEVSGYTRNKLHERDHVRQEWVPPGSADTTIERKLMASQMALRMLSNPLEYTNPHAHKMRR
eukprot:CAMPEP_0174737538 /NCGR_PEP_ID=MMETSP1094-20130205/68470_1 /TAXON_ID=156173 /ORGANISM="Chrysochromulina brevifilum, Strain UTEX LB 985" /LENGTH=359 /DNA_ID=CAMNT_0015940781 /DNA_START=1 /DNA_END=1080 /DNA_ORIENTATION=+